ncbi:MAG TPA: hypothetical protein VLI21_05085, partial [Casimicrobiaceae bacterium]|nr:hypothetical protein [Casimicrobiaceae bacterium]
MRKGLAVLALAVSASSTCMLASPAAAQVSFGFSSPGVSIGVNLGAYPELVRIPGYPVYYAPSLATNYFFYDGMYWVFDGDNWFASTWYNGPWEAVPPDEVPLFLLRVPVRYYVAAPVYFRSWSVSGPPRWGEHWGRRWEEHHRSWDRWDRSAMPAPAPLPTYQRAYAGNRYPSLSEQHVLERQHYNYRPHDRVVQQAFNARVRSAEAGPQGRAREGADAEPGQQSVGQGRAQAGRREQAHAEAVPQEQTQARIRAENQRAQRAEQTQHTQVRQQAHADRQQEQAQRAQQAQAQRAQQAQVRQQEQGQRAQQAQARQQEQAQRAQQAQAQRAEQAQAQRAQQAQARQQEQAQRAQQAQAQRAQQAQARQQEQAQRAQQAQAQHEQQNGARGRAGERRDEHNG